ncbi:YveK family protein [Mesobacillus zeae]|uniref:Capsular biosynthesis protein n=1 Tax=Mesobacillus zeae TaxID=1917180 RepID=A0A398AYJ1_9BACI|nr:Wzz/FepE/Etk N-terminal domain-containing protein [Mesobacillus zeae]RID82642.1 capsular biosynthesis protein [Mesobacillus zeae]
MEETISLKDLLGTVKKRMSLILAITLTAVMVSSIVSFFVLTPVYQASTQILVSQKKNDQASVYNPSEVQTNLQLINTYNVIIKSPVVLEQVIKNMKLKLTVEELNEKIIVGSEKDSQVVNISVKDEDAKQAAAIANTIAEVFKEKIVEIMSIDNVSILAKASVVDGQSPVAPRPFMNIAIALIVGLMGGVGLAFLLDYMDNTVKNEQDVEKVLGLPVLGAISIIEDSKMEEMKTRRTAQKTRRGESIGS